MYACHTTTAAASASDQSGAAYPAAAYPAAAYPATAYITATKAAHYHPTAYVTATTPPSAPVPPGLRSTSYGTTDTGAF
ncbi:MAG: hypothetical protein ALECFALPRED_000463 [Alectoria fallacina]|uniref:Uncharacterized protein n=1 Tax=Alectoria fallacina TaxID=1903189 RepID=A0A8H3JAL9_9LECA|nr:MAG: hypothetical protein ALECFALPRED_000463 [Alectoria fallacina]